MLRPQPLNSKAPPVFALPPAGKGPAYLARQASTLGYCAQLCAIRLPGRESRLREAPYVRLVDVVTEIRDLVLHTVAEEAWPRPTLLGFCTSARIMLEVARELHATQVPPLQVVCAYPSWPNLRAVGEAGPTDMIGLPAPIAADHGWSALFQPMLDGDIRVVQQLPGGVVIPDIEVHVLTAVNEAATVQRRLTGPNVRLHVACESRPDDNEMASSALRFITEIDSR